MSKPGLTPADTELARSISPLYFVGPDSPPALLLHGEADTVVPAQQSADFADALHAESVAANLRVWPDKGHAFFLYIPKFNLIDKPVIHLSLLETEAFLQVEQLNAYPVVHGHFSPLHLFAESDGWQAAASLSYAAGQLYGTTPARGPDGTGTVFSLDPQTRAFRLLEDAGAIPPPDPVPGGSPVAIDDSGYLYGIQPEDASTGGHLYRINADATGRAILHEFTAGLAGHGPVERLLYADGSFYGVTTFGGLTTDTGNPQTGGGMVFRYIPVASPSAARSAFVDWSAEHGLVVNQSVTSDRDQDGWELLEEFAYGGDPGIADAKSEVEIQLTEPNGLQLVVPRVRSVFRPRIKVQGSTNLQEWTFPVIMAEPPYPLDPGFERRSYLGSFDAINQEAQFLRLVIELGD